MLEVSSLDNKTAKKPRGQLLKENADFFSKMLLKITPVDILVRERGFDSQGGFSRSTATEAIWSNIGVCDMVAWVQADRIFEEIAPASVKKLVTGDGKATKEQVALKLPEYVGQVEYKVDDESDAVAVGLAWLISKKLVDPQYKISKKNSKGM